MREQTVKYYRAGTKNNETGDFRFIDSVSYTSEEAYAADLRANGYTVTLIVELTESHQMVPETFEKGTHVLHLI